MSEKRVRDYLKDIREVHPKTILMVKIGSFYRVYNSDAYIIGFLMNYKIIKKVLGVQAGFPEDSLNRVISKLEDKNINYMCLDRRNSYEVDENVSFKKNKYSWFLERAKNSIDKKMKLETIVNILTDRIDSEETKEILDKIEGILNEYNYI